MTIEEKNRYFCSFIKEYFDITPRPILPYEIKKHNREHAAIYVHTEAEAKALGYFDIDWAHDESCLLAPWFDTESSDDEFDDYWREEVTLNYIRDFDDWSGLIDDHHDDPDLNDGMSECIARYGKVYYVASHADNLLDLEEFI